jgi:hypothetical protein
MQNCSSDPTNPTSGDCTCPSGSTPTSMVVLNGKIGTTCINQSKPQFNPVCDPTDGSKSAQCICPVGKKAVPAGVLGLQPMYTCQ